MLQRTLSIVKPDAVSRNLIGEIIKRFESGGLKITSLRMVNLRKEDAKRFYEIHKDKPFYDSLTSFMSSGPCVPMIIEGEGAIDKVRKIMGATDPKKADKGTIRKDFAENIERNAVHGSDSQETAKEETAFFFSRLESVEQLL